MAVKRRSVEVFSISFLDCICCGFGAVLLLFVLTIGRQTNAQESIVSEIKRIISRLDRDITVEQQQTGDLRNRLRIRFERIAREASTLDVTKRDQTDLQKDLALLLLQQASLKDELERLLGEKKNIPKTDEKPPIPIPNVRRRQYLTGFNFEGNNIVIMIESSGGMIADTIDQVIARTGITDEERRKAVKWRRVVVSVQWIIANLTPDQGYQVMVFSNEAKPLLPERAVDWLDPQDRETTAEVIQALETITPKGGANHERAFGSVNQVFPGVDTIMLLTDGLPTQGDSITVGSVTDDRDRERLFRAALRVLPKEIVVNTILYPMSGDPAAAFLYWQLADRTKGALISPSPSWPDL
jgi:hypothetical protein